MSSVLFLNIELGGKTKLLEADQNWTVKQLYDVVAAHMTNADPNTFYLVADGTTLDLKKSVREYRLMHNQTILYVQRTHGGSGVTPLDGYVQLTTQPCSLTFDANPAELRAKMPCGHVFARDMIQHQCTTDIKDGKCTFACPICQAPWDFFVVRHILSAAMGSDQLNVISRQLVENYVRAPQQDIRQCVMCKTYSQRDFTRLWQGSMNRVVCNVCTKKNQGRTVEFCWLCGQQWRGGNGDSCGNDNCLGPAATLRMLATCSTKTINNVDGCPDTRACPRCGMLIYHVAKCKHMKCEFCGLYFCFVCLKPKDELQGWQCGSFSTKCPVAPRQTTLPGQ